MSEPNGNGRIRFIALWTFIAVTTALIALALALWLAAFLSDFAAFRHLLLHEHFQALVGLPAAAFGAFVIVVLFRQAETPIRIKALGFELEGAAGPVVLWFLCFVAIAGTLKLLW